MLKKIFTNSVIYSVGPQIPKVAGIFILPIITRYLNSTDYGVQGVITAYTGILSALADLGMAVVMVNAFYKYPQKWQIVWKQIHGYLIIWSIVFAFIQGVLLIFVIPREARENLWKLIALICIPIILFNTTILFGARFYQYSQKPTYVAFSTAIVGIISLVSNYVTIAYFRMGYMGWFISSFIGSFVLFLFYVFPVYRKYKLSPIFAYRVGFLKRNLKVSLPTIPHDYSAYLINSSDRAVFGALGIKINLQGLYNMAYIFGNYFEFFGNSIGMAIGPTYTKLFSNQSQENEDNAKRLTFLMQTLFLCIGFFICLWCRELMSLLIKNKELSNAYPLAIIIIMGYVYRPMYWAAGIKLTVLEKTNKLWRISFIAGIMNVVLNFIFVPRYGITVAAFTTYFSLLYMGFAGYYIRINKKQIHQNYMPLFWLILILISTLIVYLIRDLEIKYKLGISITILCALIFLYKDFRGDISKLSEAK